MRASVASRLAVPLLVAGLLLPAPATADEPICAQTLPAATDGRVTLDHASVRPGDRTLALLSDFRVWPTGLIGGGSGETFLSCAPWQPLGRAEVMPQRSAALFLITVPKGTAPGTYSVGVVFHEGSTTASGDGQVVRLSTSLTVTDRPTAGTGTSPACRAGHPAAAVGRLAVPATARPGATVRLAVAGVAAERLSLLNEYHQLWYVVCLAGRASPVTRLASPASPFTVLVPQHAPAGRTVLAAYGVLDGRVVSWQRTIVVGNEYATSSPAATTTSTALPSSTPTADAGGTPAAGPSEGTSGPSAARLWPLGLLIGLVVAGLTGTVLSRRSKPRRSAE